ncbi:MAG TPA: hypothetical protein VF103_10955 [Polyangiaceae bacterium]
MTAPAPRERVVLVDEELVVERGSVKIAWLVSHNDGWIPASKCEGATSKRLDTSPRVVWRSSVEVELPRGTRVLRVETRPSQKRGSTLAHLTGSARSAGQGVVKTRFVVGPGGRLAPEPEKNQTTK